MVRSLFLFGSLVVGGVLLTASAGAMESVGAGNGTMVAGVVHDVAEAAPTKPDDVTAAPVERSSLDRIERDVAQLRLAIEEHANHLNRLHGQVLGDVSDPLRIAQPFTLFGMGIVACLLASGLWRRLAAGQVAAPPAVAIPAAAQAGADDADLTQPLALQPGSGDASAHAAEPAAAAVQATSAAAPTTRPGLLGGSVGPVLGLLNEFDEVEAEELIDIRQQAQFFAALGQPERSIEILRGHIDAHPSVSEQAWEDLLELYQSLGMNAEFRAARQRYQAVIAGTASAPRLATP